MALSIKNAKADRLARQLAPRTGESLTEAVRRALELRLWRLVSRERYAAAFEQPAAGEIFGREKRSPRQRRTASKIRKGKRNGS